MKKSKIRNIWAAALIAILFVAATATAAITIGDKRMAPVECEKIEFNDYTPSTPTTPDGPIELYVGEDGTYTTVSTIEGGGNIKYIFDWGDNQIEELSDPYPSGTPCEATHSWHVEPHGIGWTWGLFLIRAQAKNAMSGGASDWSEPLLIRVGVYVAPPDGEAEGSIAVLNENTATYILNSVNGDTYTGVTLVESW